MTIFDISTRPQMARIERKYEETGTIPLESAMNLIWDICSDILEESETSVKALPIQNQNDFCRFYSQIVVHVVNGIYNQAAARAVIEDSVSFSGLEDYYQKIEEISRQIAVLLPDNMALSEAKERLEEKRRLLSEEEDKAEKLKAACQRLQDEIDSRKDTELAALLNRQDTLLNEKKSLLDQIKEAKDQNEALVQEISDAKEEARKVRETKTKQQQEKDKLEQSIRDIKKNIGEIEKNNETLNKDVAQRTTELKAVQDKEQKQQDRKKEIEDEIAALEQSTKKLTGELIPQADQQREAAAQKLQNQNQELQSLEQQKKELEENYQKDYQKIQELRDKTKDLTTQFNAAEELLKKINTDNLELELRLGEKSKEITDLNQKIKDNRDALERDDFQETIRIKQDELKKLKEQLDTARRTLSDLNTEIANKKDALDKEVKNYNETKERFRKEEDRMKEEQSSREKELLALQSRNRDLIQESARLEKDYLVKKNEFSGKNKALQERIERYSVMFRDLQSQDTQKRLDQLETYENRLTRLYEQLVTEFRSYGDEGNALKKELDVIEAKIQSCRKMYRDIVETLKMGESLS